MKIKPKFNMWQSIKYVLSIAKKHKKDVIVMVFIISFIQVALNLTQLYIAPVILNKVETYAPLKELIATIAVFTAVMFILSALKKYTLLIEQTGQLHLRTKIIFDLHNKILTTSYPNTFSAEANKLFEVAYNATDANPKAAEHIWKTFTSLLTNILGFIAYLTVLSNANILLIVITFFTAVVSFLCHRYIDKWYYKHRDKLGEFEQRFQYIDQKSRSVELAKDIRIFGTAQWFKDIYENTLNLMKDFVFRREKAYLKVDLIEWFAGIVRNGISYIFLLYMVITNSLSASEFLLYFTAISTFSQWVTGILSDISVMRSECRDIGTILEYIDYPEPFRFEGGIAIPKAKMYEWRLEDVTFSYPETTEKIFEHLNLTIKPGEKIAIVGLNGAGKTTLVKLLCGFFDPDKGRVTLNGIDIREFNRREYYDLLCAVYQNYSVLDASIAQNIAQKADNYDTERIWHCLRQAGLESYVQSLPYKLDTKIGRDIYLDGIILSGGQTQRLLLARALYKDGPLLILDEPTAALDPIAENDIYLKYNELTKGKTSVFISHRLASTRFCDRIIFISNGRITEEGTHEELLKLDGEYAKLFEVQSRYYKEGADFNE